VRRRRHCHFGTGERFSQVDDLRFAEDILIFDGLQEVDVQFDGGGILIRQNQRHRHLGASARL
jgi:hypothetical protein